MRGSPLIRALIVFAVLVALAPFIQKMTASEGTPRQERPPSPASTDLQDIALTLEFTRTPTRARILHLGKEVWAKQNPEATEELMLRLPWPNEGGELQFTIEWREAESLAGMRATLVDPDRGEIERSLWGRGSKTDVLNFP
jgi:hypothetical protein